MKIKKFNENKSDRYKTLENVKVFSLCDTFYEEEDDYESFARYNNPDCYVRHRLDGTSPSIDDRLIEFGAKPGELVLIEIDY